MARSVQGNKMESQEDKLMAASLACLQELRRNVHDVAERIAEQVCETEEHLQHYVQFELIKAAVCIKNVTEKLAAYVEKNGYSVRENQQKPQDILVKGEKCSVVSFVPAWADDSLANTESDVESMSEQNNIGPGLVRQHTEDDHQTRVNSADLDPNSPPPTFQSKTDEPRHECRDRTVFVDGLDRPIKVRGNSLPSKSTDNTHVPRRHFHWKQATHNVSSHAMSQERPLVGRSSPFDSTARGRDKGFSGKSSKDSQDWLGEHHRTHRPPDSRFLARQRSPSPNCRHSNTYEGSLRHSATERPGPATRHQRRHSHTPSEEVHAGRPCSHSEYRLPVIGTILPHYDSVQTRSMKKRQDHNMRQLFGL